ncbi:MAG: cyclase family protein [Actinobacteria bacterium]|nr:cyclase family protein [Actinomycetota bacterium]
MTEQKINNGPAVTFDDFSSLFQSIKSWNDYTPATIERGALNYITPEVTKSATQLVITGEVVIMGLAWNTVAGPDNQKPALHYMSEIGDTPNEEPTCNKDFIGVDYHGKAVSHLDAMTHIAFQDTLFGGKKSSEVVNSTGSAWATVDKLGPIVTRGVILDAARFAGKEWIEPGTAIHADDILAYEKKFGFILGQGDCVLLRSGHFARREKLGVWDPSDFSAGFHVDVMQLFKDRKISVIGADGDSDVRPSPVAGVGSPIHVLALPGLGIPLLDNLQLEAVAQKCAELNRWTFNIVIAPLNIPRGTGSPVNPIAIF